MGIKRNAGEWAEFYVLLKILSEGKLYAADGDLNKLNEHFFPVISIKMQQSGFNKENTKSINYLIDSQNKKITIHTEGKTESISMAELKIEADNFFKIISNRKGAAFEVPEISNILEQLQEPETKRSSSKKADIHIVIHDVMTGIENEVGFSIKSKHSHPATLINASGQTLFQYKIQGNQNNYDCQRIKKALQAINNEQIKIGPKARIKKLTESGFALRFNSIKSIQFKENIQLIDSFLDIFLADCLLVFMKSNMTKLSEIVNEVSLRNPCQYITTDSDRLHEFYQYKMKRLIVDAALGMQPRTAWTGQYDVSGGYIVVKNTGDIVCYHLYNWNSLQDYLYNNLKFETPVSTGKGSKKSFNYALYYSEDNKHLVDICLQMRFK